MSSNAGFDPCFLFNHSKSSMEQYAEIILNSIFGLHTCPSRLRDLQFMFTLNLWTSLIFNILEQCFQLLSENRVPYPTLRWVLWTFPKLPGHTWVRFTIFKHNLDIIISYIIVVYIINIINPRIPWTCHSHFSWNWYLSTNLSSRRAVEKNLDPVELNHMHITHQTGLQDSDLNHSATIKAPLNHHQTTIKPWSASEVH